jgi:hypothetical protein
MAGDMRLKLLNDWAGGIAQNAKTAIFGGRPVQLMRIETVSGPRAGALEIHAGVDSGRFMRSLSADDFALHRQFIPWRFNGEPAVYMTSRFVRLEAGWPDELAERDITLASIGANPKNDGRWIAGKNETGQTITLGVSDTVPHFLFGGWTGSGKTWAMRSALAQLSNDPKNDLVLVDAKFGDGLGALAHVPGLMGPVATDIETTKAALSWVVGQMRRRYETGNKASRLIVAIDEIQELTGKSGDPAIIEMVRKLAAQGRGARIHLLLGTQHPTIDTFSDPTIKRNLSGRVALRCEDFKASEIVCGGPSPRADRLLGAGDSYAITPSAIHRAQMAYIPSPELARYNTSEPAMSAWPDYDPEAAGSLPSENGAGWKYSGPELAVSLIHAYFGSGRPALIDDLEACGLGRPGSDRAARLLELGRDQYAWMQENDWDLSDNRETACLPGEDADTPENPED